MTQQTSNWQKLRGAVFLILMFWIPWFAFTVITPFISHAFEKINGEPPTPTSTLIDAFANHGLTYWLIVATGVAIPVLYLLLPRERWQKIYLATSSICVVLALSASIIAIGIAVPAAATIASVRH